MNLREELAWFIVKRMDDAVGFDEAYEEVGEYLKLIEKRIDSEIDGNTRANNENYQELINSNSDKELQILNDKGHYIKGYGDGLRKVKEMLNKKK